MKVAQTLPPGSKIVTILCDSGIRHMSRFWNKVGPVCGGGGGGGDGGGITNSTLEDILAESRDGGTV